MYAKREWCRSLRAGHFSMQVIAWAAWRATYSGGKKKRKDKERNNRAREGLMRRGVLKGRDEREGRTPNRLGRIKQSAGDAPQHVDLARGGEHFPIWRVLMWSGAPFLCDPKDQDGVNQVCSASGYNKYGGPRC